MSRLIRSVSAIAIAASMVSGSVQAQNLLQELQVPGFSLPVPLSPYQKTAEWDYRFDPQYQSTIKPYLRWYMRYDPTQPGNRILPRDFGFGLNYGLAYLNPAAIQRGHSNYFSTCPGCGYGWDARMSDPNNRPSLYWNHLRYLSDVHGRTPANGRTGQLRNNERSKSHASLNSPLRRNAPANSGEDLIDTAYRGRIIAQRTIWVARNPSTGTYSVLYREPPTAVADQFSKAHAEIGTGAKIVHLRWAASPPWAESVQLIAGRLSSRL